MTEFSSIIRHVSRFISLTDEEEQIFTSLLRIQKVKKKQSIVQPEFVCKYRTYRADMGYRSDATRNTGQYFGYSC